MPHKLATGLELRPLYGPTLCPPNAQGIRCFVGGPSQSVGRAAVDIPDPLISRLHAEIRAVSSDDGAPTLFMTCLSKNPMLAFLGPGRKPRVIGHGAAVTLNVGDQMRLYAGGGPITSGPLFEVVLLPGTEGHDGAAAVRVQPSLASEAPPRAPAAFPRLPSAATGAAPAPAPQAGRVTSLHFPAREATSREAVLYAAALAPVTENRASAPAVAVKPIPSILLPAPRKEDASEALRAVGVLAAASPPVRAAAAAEPESLLSPVVVESSGVRIAAQPGGAAAAAAAEPAASFLSPQDLSGASSGPRRALTLLDRRFSTFQSARQAAAGTSPYFPRSGKPAAAGCRGAAAAAEAAAVVDSPGTDVEVARSQPAAAPAPRSLVVDLLSSPEQLEPQMQPRGRRLPESTGKRVGDWGHSQPPAAAAAVAAAAEDGGEGGGDDLCPICRESLRSRPSLGLLPCSHAFCFDCIVAWSGITNHCCLCKREFSAVQELRREEGGRAAAAAAAAGVPGLAPSLHGYAAAGSRVVASRRQAPAPHHVDEDAALAWRLAMEDDGGAEAHAYEVDDEEEEEGGSSSGSGGGGLSDDDVAAIEADGWINPRAPQRSRSGASRAGNSGRSRGGRAGGGRGRSSARGPRWYSADGGSSSHEEDEEGIAAGPGVIEHDDGRDYRCRVCRSDRSPDVLLLCDGCDAAQHTFCCTPPLAEVPEGLWLCASCCERHEREAPALPRPLFVQQLQAEAAVATARRLTEAAAAAPPPRRAEAEEGRHGAREAERASGRSAAQEGGSRHGHRRRRLRRMDNRAPGVVRRRPSAAAAAAPRAAAAAAAAAVDLTGDDPHWSPPPFASAAPQQPPPPAAPRQPPPRSSSAVTSDPWMRGPRDALAAAVQQVRAAKATAARLPRGEFAHAIAGEAPHMLLPARQLASEHANLARHTASRFDAPSLPAAVVAGLPPSFLVENAGGSLQVAGSPRLGLLSRSLKRLRRPAESAGAGGARRANGQGRRARGTGGADSEGDSDHSMALGESRY